jgi:hypothetical protein
MWPTCNKNCINESWRESSGGQYVERFAWPGNAGEKKPARRPVFLRANYFAEAAAEAAEAAAEAAVEAAAVASAAAEAATEAAAAASAAAAAGAAAGAGASTTGAGATTGSSFLLQAAKATANREMISKDFFIGFP